ncbi:aspartyl/glutamyl-tRNA amidotransferase subunit A [Candidatus Levyibacteriota bacterium]|nr:Asp-tRNA(Asn)/Glu-tRNA(Gln) amidotransferase subunit GatA [Candidatus Levybacteria bacterium]MSU25889.1 Asp-tRNA(Asn)/Glu-tRNA(Gln) amidotransferase subunit GatA [Candidatus Levybacteria bacterium]GDX61931.1 aspartyl/glutamyl-tRNA amidotransferase subunit A [Candidatus Levybacteria bacterium]
MKLNQLTIKEAGEGLRAKKFSSLEITEAVFNQIDNVENKINAFVTITKEEALINAKEADIRLAKNDDLPLLGIPIAIKDNFCTIGVRTTASSKLLDNFIPQYDATVVKRLKESGMVLLGKTNLDAWAHGSSTETSDYGSSKNPWNIDYLPGGSSGGSAACIAADEAIGAIGSETAGSIRQPASWCGVVGLKPTYGRVSRYGVIAMASSLDSPGPITKTVEDSALLFDVISGHDVHDATSSPIPPISIANDIKKSIDPITIGISDDYFDGVDDEVKKIVENAIFQFEKLGAKIKKISLFAPKYAIAVYTILQRSEVSSNLARYDGIRYGNDRSFFEEEARRRIILGTYTLSAGYYDQYYNKALKVRTVIIENFNEAFKEVDIILSPTSPSTALPLGSTKNHPMFGEIADMLVEPSSIAGLPGISIPCGFSSIGLPIGMQLIGPQFSEALIVRAAYLFEQSTEWHKVKPNI